MSEPFEITVTERHPHRVGMIAGRSFYPGSQRAYLRPAGPYVVERAVDKERASLVSAIRRDPSSARPARGRRRAGQRIVTDLSVTNRCFD